MVAAELHHELCYTASVPAARLLRQLYSQRPLRAARRYAAVASVVSEVKMSGGYPAGRYRQCPGLRRG